MLTAARRVPAQLGEDDTDEWEWVRIPDESPHASFGTCMVGGRVVRRLVLTAAATAAELKVAAHGDGMPLSRCIFWWQRSACKDRGTSILLHTQRSQVCWLLSMPWLQDYCMELGAGASERLVASRAIDR
jgi:hypothetical protein